MECEGDGEDGSDYYFFARPVSLFFSFALLLLACVWVSVWAENKGEYVLPVARGPLILFHQPR